MSTPGPMLEIDSLPVMLVGINLVGASVLKTKNVLAMHCMFHPYYFSFLACNVAGAQVEGTSKEWV